MHTTRETYYCILLPSRLDQICVFSQASFPGGRRWISGEDLHYFSRPIPWLQCCLARTPFDHGRLSCRRTPRLISSHIEQGERQLEQLLVVSEDISYIRVYNISIRYDTPTFPCVFHSRVPHNNGPVHEWKWFSWIATNLVPNEIISYPQLQTHMANFMVDEVVIVTQEMLSRFS